MIFSENRHPLFGIMLCFIKSKRGHEGGPDRWLGCWGFSTEAAAPTWKQLVSARTIEQQH